MKNKKTFAVISLLLLMAAGMNAQTTVKLWHTAPPTTSGLTGEEKDENGGEWIHNITVPTLEIYQPVKSRNTGMAVIICPGGGYAGVAYNKEGIQLAQWLTTQGITGIVLKYRMPNGHKEIPLDDVHQAFRYVRENAPSLNIDRNMVGISGFSAGGHLAATASTNYTQDTRPDFSILFYPVITMGEGTHQGSRDLLLGKSLSKELLEKYSIEKQVTPDTPPAILFLSSDDGAVLPLNSIGYYNALLAHQVPASMYIFPVGGHGWGINYGFRYNDEVLSLTKKWLEEIRNKKS
ncbi:alpha/beta hydrolase [Dysgonomonas sp. 25]|uniref:alpha/beta hydrolase n=1 Tax=Dysgonomonas sp. 25 TaxID=2302933 RepID=UPI0013D3A32F|nr:alpha/beta hydrolase [Dysgonomonas sp. 25]NDV68015.1 alpha/beta hydrolase [Dysgonomonas sp. 25]